MRAISALAVLGAACVLTVLLSGGGGALAQSNTQEPAAEATDAASPDWTGTVSTPEHDPNTPQFSEEQLATIEKVSGYFSDLKNLKGIFLQTDPDKKQSRGKFYVKKPGRFRFDYGAPSLKVIVSDGRWLAIQDHDLNTEDIYQLDDTPFRLLLRENVNLLQEAHIFDVQEVEDLIIIALQDKDPDVSGRITLFLGKEPALALREWVTIDPQGLETRVQLSQLDTTEDLDPALFKRENLSLKKFQQ